ncbi:contractile injection system protein, VgrG/Pvc8 family [Luteimonas sp. MJ250]|uniref:contractile injection system protein, VgrG/Pvc8 family n=1 Tax=Luteimonas sp. MJ250 TaxID=3129236 RepID=UPI0031BAA7FC
MSVFRDRLQTTPTARAISSWQTEQVAALAAQAEADATGLPPLEVFTEPRSGRFTNTAQAQLQADLQLDALRVARQLQAGAGSARVLAPGSAFTLTRHERPRRPSLRGAGGRAQCLQQLRGRHGRAAGPPGPGRRGRTP